MIEKFIFRSNYFEEETGEHNYLRLTFSLELITPLRKSQWEKGTIVSQI